MIIQVYRNLHKKCYSLRNKKTKRVEEHAQKVILKNVKFKVSEKGRQRVLKEQRKNVHAFIEGEKLKRKPNNLHLLPRHVVKYNPYKYSTFVFLADDCPIYNADYVELTPYAVYAYFIKAL